MIKIIFFFCFTLIVTNSNSQTFFEEIISVSAKRQKVFWESSGYELTNIDTINKSETYTQILDSQLVHVVVLFNSDYSDIKSISFYFEFVESYNRFLKLAEKELVEGEKKNDSRIFVLKNLNGWVYFSEPMIERKQKYFMSIVKQKL